MQIDDNILKIIVHKTLMEEWLNAFDLKIIFSMLKNDEELKGTVLFCLDNFDAPEKQKLMHLLNNGLLYHALYDKDGRLTGFGVEECSAEIRDKILIWAKEQFTNSSQYEKTH